MAQTADSEGAPCVSFYHSPAKSITFSRDLLQRLMVSKEAVVCPPEETVDKKEEIQGEMGLNLGLSLGGYLDGKAKEEAPCSQKAGSGNFQPRLRKLASGNVETDGKELRNSQEDGQADCELALPSMVRKDKERGTSGLMTQASQQLVLPEIKHEGAPMTQIHRQPTARLQQEMLEQQRKREMHALRRQEARKKREEKQLKKARKERGMPIQASKVRNGSLAPLLPSYAPLPMRGSVFPSRIGMDSEKRVLESQMSSVRKKDRAAKENELTSDRETKIKEKVVRDLSERGDSQDIERRNSKTSPARIEHTVPSPTGGDRSTSREFPYPSYPALPTPHPLSVLPNNSQCMSLPIGLPYPHPMPFWTATKRCDAPKANIPPFSNVLQPIPARALPPLQMPISGTSPGGFADPQTRPAQSSHAPGASPARSSPAVSEYESRSSQGAVSNDSKSQSTASSALHRFSSVSNSQDQALHSSELSASSELDPRCAEEAPEKAPANTAESALEVPSTATPHETEVAEASSATKPSEHQSASKATVRNSDDRKASEGKLPDTPLVLTTCGGPNGKRVFGFLHSYSKDEVRIVCACHGTFLSPAEFVQHAGGTDLAHPERHIVVHQRAVNH